MIDLHCHILPDIDDGARNIDESFAMARTAVQSGIHTAVATPHTLNGIYSNSAEKINRISSALQQSLLSEEITLTIIPGAEVHACPGLMDLVKQGEAATINNNGKYLLVELPSMVLPAEIKEEFFTLKLHGITPIIVHPERNLILQQQLDLAMDFVRMGTLLQVTAASITGTLGTAAQECVKKMLEARLAHVIASDSHSATNRPQNLQRAVEIAAGILADPAEAERLVSETPAAIIAGNALDVPEPRQAGKKKWFSFLRR